MRKSSPKCVTWVGEVVYLQATDPQVNRPAIILKCDESNTVNLVAFDQNGTSNFFGNVPYNDEPEVKKIGYWVKIEKGN